MEHFCIPRSRHKKTVWLTDGELLQKKEGTNCRMNDDDGFV